MVNSGDVRGLYIPRVFTFPQEFRIVTRQVKPTKMRELHGEDYDGIWDVDNMCIDLKRNLPLPRKWFVYSHELVHAINDWQLWLINQGIAAG